MYLQVAYGGYYIKGEEDHTLSDLNYYEPGYNIMYPLELEVDSSDRFYIILRKRNTSGGYDTIDIDNLSITVKDSTNGENIPFYAKLNNISSSWNKDPSYTDVPVLLIDSAIDLNNPTIRVRSLDCSITDLSDNSFIFFRATMNIDTDSTYLNYIPIKVKDINNRNKYSASGRNVYITLSSGSDFYVILSPYSYLSETTKSLSDFSYPINTIFYKKQKTYNEEEFTYSIDSYSHSFMSDYLSFHNIPGFNKVGILLIDQMLYEKMLEIGANTYINLAINGIVSNSQDTFKVNFIT